MIGQGYAELNWYVLAAAALLSLMTGMLFGLAPAIQSMRVDLMSSLKDLRSGEFHRGVLGRMGLVRVLIVAQMAITLMIFVGNDDPEIVPFYSDLRARFAAIPGVRSAILSDMQLIGRGTSGMGIRIDRWEQKGSRILTVGSGCLPVARPESIR